jgi:uncharacterized protein YodC (DUF2158 family)
MVASSRPRSVDAHCMNTCRWLYGATRVVFGEDEEVPSPTSFGVSPAILGALGA